MLLGKHESCQLGNLNCNKLCKILSKSSVIQYNSIYNGMTSNPCSKSDNNFDQDSNLMKHQGTEFSENHSKSNKYKNAFYQNSILLHIRDSYGEKTYKCSECDKGFNQSFILQRNITSVINLGKSL